MPHAEIERQPQTEWKKQLRTYQTSISSMLAKTNSHLGANCVFPWISWSHAPNLHFLGKNLGANCVFPWISWSQKPQTCIPWEKPIRTWVRIVFSHGSCIYLEKKKPIFAPGCELCFLIDFGVITQTPNLHSLWENPIGNLVGGWGGGVVGWRGGGLCISKRTLTGPHIDLKWT